MFLVTALSVDEPVPKVERRFTGTGQRRRCHLDMANCSSIVNCDYQDNFKPVYFFFDEKILRAQKHVTSKNQLTKQKQVNTKQQKQQFSTRT